jgi:hypothetical protein
MNKPKNHKRVVEIKGRKYLHLYKGTSLEWLKKDRENYLDHTRHISFTTDRSVAEEFASINHSDGFTPIIIEVLAPINEVNFNYSILPKLSKMFSYGNDAGQKEYSAMLQVPLSWMKGYWKFENGKYNKNKKFDPKSVPTKIPLAAIAPYKNIYEKRMPQELKELENNYPDIENLWDERWKKYFQLEEKRMKYN